MWLTNALNRWAADRDGWSYGAYRWRTWLRGKLPYRLGWIARPGPHDCGNHEWHNHDHVVERCYHCLAERPCRPEWRQAAARRPDPAPGP